MTSRQDSHRVGHEPAVPPADRSEHHISCVYCRQIFDLFAAFWCSHADEPQPSKICPHCSRCLCLHPCYKDEYFWKDAPVAFRENGFRRLFLLYI